MKNFSIITLIFVVPLVAYMLLSKPDVSFANKVTDANKPQIIKFTSLMCLDCKKLSKIEGFVEQEKLEKLMKELN